jgi:hypothetical protein
MAGRKQNKLKKKKKALARDERNKAQAEEESKVWGEIRKKAADNVEVYKAKRGRPTVMTEEVQKEILDRLTAGQSLSAICALDHMPNPSVLYYFMEKSPSFAEKYARACGGLATMLFMDALAIADNDSRDIIKDPQTGEIMLNNTAVQRDRLRIDTRFRMASKLSGKYADKPILGDNATVTVNTLSVNARDMDPDSRDKLRALLLQARENVIDV